MIDVSGIKKRFSILSGLLDERSRRLVAARIDDDAHEDAAEIEGADHIGRAFPARPRERMKSGGADDLVDLVRRHEAGQRRRR